MMKNKRPDAVTLPVAWTSEGWAQPVIVRRSLDARWQRNTPVVVPMLTHRCVRPAARRGFTLIEMLVVIAIIGILAAIIVPVLGRAKARAKITAARHEMGQIEAAIAAYQAQYTLPPIPRTLPGGADRGQDYSFTNNSDIVSILMALPRGANADPDHARNPQRSSFLHANLKPGTASGVSSDDYNYRDPWGNPYIIAFDLDFDNEVSVPGDANHPSITVPRSVIVWSKGPDGQAQGGNDREGTNKDNIRSWE